MVLQEAEGPLHYRELTRRMLERGLWSTRGETPWNTVNARLATDIRDRGLASQFVRTAPGHFALNSVPTEESPVAERPRIPRTNEDEGTTVLSFTDAAEQILLQSLSREPLHYSTITELALDQGLIRTEGRTPSATMYSVILSEIRRHEARGESPRFVQHGRGLVGLTIWLPVGVAALIEENNQEVRQKLLGHARSVPPASFEVLVGELLAAMGFEDIEVTNVSADGGIDVRGTLVMGEAMQVRMAVQAKRWKNNVPAPVVQQLRGSLGAHEQGLIITTSDFSRGAKGEATRSDAAPVALMNGEQFAALLAKHEIGAHVQRYDFLTLNDAEESQG